MGAVWLLNAGIGDNRPAIILEARNAFLRSRCMQSDERLLVPGDLVRSGKAVCGPTAPAETVSPLDNIVVKEGGTVIWAVCADAGAYKRTLTAGQHDISRPGLKGAELGSSEAGFCAPGSMGSVVAGGLDDVRDELRDAGEQHVRTLIAQAARQCDASLPECARTPRVEEPLNPLQLLSRAIAAEGSDPCSSLWFYSELKRHWPAAGWIDHKMAHLEFVRAVHYLGSRSPDPGAVASLAIGIARYRDGQKTLEDKALLYPANDAVLLGKYFKAAGAQGRVITARRGDPDQRATAARLFGALVEMTCGSGKARDAIVFISSHGIEDDSRISYIVPEDGYSGYPRINGVSVRQIQDVLRPFARTYLLVDACREPGKVVPGFRALSTYLQSGARPVANPFDLVIQSVPAGARSRTDPVAAKVRCAQARGLLHCGPAQAEGYGDFAYHFVDAVANRKAPGTLTGRMLRSDLTAKLGGKAPDFGTLSDADELGTLKTVPLSLQQTTRRRMSLFVNAAFFQARAGDIALQELRDQIREGNQLSSEEMDRMTQAAADASPEEIEETRLTLEDAGQAVIRRYLEGDEIEPDERWFRAGASYFRAAQLFVPGSAMYRARALFCEARLQMFRVPAERDLARRARIVAVEVMPKLWAAQRLDPDAAYTLNAMGIAHLELGQYEEARRFLTDAVFRQPYWAYPRHNLALTFMQQGRLRDALAAFGQAIDSAPNYAYLHHSQALLYQRLNRRRDAEDSYHAAELLLTARRANQAEWRAQRAKLFNAWGTLRAQSGDKRGAMKFYRRAASESSLPEIDFNLAQLESGPARISLLRALLLKYPDHFATRVELARTLAQLGSEEGIHMLRDITAERPGYVGAWTELGLALARSGDTSGALQALAKAGSGWRARLLEASIARSRGESSARALRRQAEREAGIDMAARKEIRAEWKRRIKRDR